MAICKWLIDQICNNELCEQYLDMPHEIEYCEKCEYFEEIKKERDRNNPAPLAPDGNF